MLKLELAWPNTVYASALPVIGEAGMLAPNHEAIALTVLAVDPSPLNPGQGIVSVELAEAMAGKTAWDFRYKIFPAGFASD